VALLNSSDAMSNFFIAIVVMRFPNTSLECSRSSGYKREKSLKSASPINSTSKIEPMR